MSSVNENQNEHIVNETLPSQETLLHYVAEDLEQGAAEEPPSTESSSTEVDVESQEEAPFVLPLRKYYKNRPAPAHQFLTVDSYLWDCVLGTTPTFRAGTFCDGKGLFWVHNRDGVYKTDCEVRTLQNGGRRVVLSLRLQLMPFDGCRWSFAEISTEMITPGVRFLNVVELQTLRQEAEPRAMGEPGVEYYTGEASDRSNDPKDRMMTSLYTYGHKSFTSIRDADTIGKLKPGWGLRGYFLVLFPVDVPQGIDRIELSYKVKLHRQGRIFWRRRHRSSNEGSVSLSLHPAKSTDEEDDDTASANRDSAVAVNKQE